MTLRTLTVAAFALLTLPARAGVDVEPSDVWIDMPYGTFPGHISWVGASLTNHGNTDAPSFSVSARLSTNTIISKSDPEICGWYTTLRANTTVTDQWGFCNIPMVTPGLYYVGFILDEDNLVAETDEANNTAYDPVPLLITENVDLTVTGVQNGLDRGVVGDPLTVDFTRGNEGYFPAAPYTARVYLSQDAVITETDVEACSVEITDQAGESSVADQITCPVPAIPDGVWYVGVMVDADDAILEISETNNTDVDRVNPLVVGPTLEVSRLFPGQDAILTVAGLAPGEKAYFAMGFQTGAGPCPLGACLGVLEPKLLGSATADAGGRADLTVSVPPTAPQGKTVYFQGVAASDPATTTQVVAGTVL